MLCMTNKSDLLDLGSLLPVIPMTSRFIATNKILPLRIGNTEVTSSSHVRDLGVIIDKNMTMSQHVSSICRNVSFALYSIGKLRTYLDQSSTEKLVHSSVHDLIVATVFCMGSRNVKYNDFREFRTPQQG